MVDRDDVVRARSVVETHLVRTPMLRSRTLGARLKCELFQRTGSFKPRGALNKLSTLTEDEKSRGVIAISAGNHAQATAFAAAEYGVDALIVMWQGASEQKIEATRSYGGTVDLESTSPVDAWTRLEELIEETGRTLVHPFDDPAIMAGAGTVGLEIEEDAPDADTVIVPVGGGGLIGGIVAAIGSGRRIVGRRARGQQLALRRTAGRPPGSRHPEHDRRRAERPLRRGDRARALPRPRGRPRHRRGDQDRIPFPLPAREARLRARRRRRGRRPPGRQDRGGQSSRRSQWRQRQRPNGL